MPTSLSLAQVKRPEDVEFDGIDVGPALFQGKALPERAVIWGRNPEGAIRVGSWKLVGKELYHIAEDPKEKKNLADQNRERVLLMMKQRQKIFAQAIRDSPYD